MAEFKSGLSATLEAKSRPGATPGAAQQDTAETEAAAAPAPAGKHLREVTQADYYEVGAGGLLAGAGVVVGSCKMVWLGGGTRRCQMRRPPLQRERAPVWLPAPRCRLPPSALPLPPTAAPGHQGVRRQAGGGGLLHRVVRSGSGAVGGRHAGAGGASRLVVVDCYTEW